MLRWVQLVAIDPDYVTTGLIVKGGTARNMRYSDVPVARTRVLFIAFDAPVRCISIIDVDDGSYGLTT